MMSEGTCAAQRASIRDELEFIIGRLQETKFSFSNILDDLDGPAPEGEPSAADRNPNRTAPGVASIRNQLADLTVIISQIEAERDRLLVIRDNLIGSDPGVGIDSAPKSTEIRRGNWGSHP